MSDKWTMLLTSLALLYALYSFRNEIKNAIKKLSYFQLASMLLSFIGVVAIATFFIYYIGNYLLHFVQVPFLHIIAQYTIIIIVIGCSIYALRFALKKIANDGL